ncbi:guanine nucleotide-binding protein subunit alpha-12-like [Sycon ciliatum]|uniref:guanine nucleotide-binding protein subunit alpha-12-like n=1 Tax=Sycon ciliatum TaxID=27933 RepID=UPI0020ABDFB5|eukprot:scpid81513/ scgid22017/ Guanine nucleotide-binding protein subunit alpha-12
MAWRCCAVSRTSERVAQDEHSKEIDKRLQLEKAKQKGLVKVLLLGAGESGKSTFLKQMRIIHGQGFEEQEFLEYRTIIFDNIISSAQKLVRARKALNIPWNEAVNEAHGNLIEAAGPVDTPEEFVQYYAALDAVWGDDGIQRTYERRSEFHLGDSTNYFFNNLSSIATLDYLPCKQDILCSRKSTRGVQEYSIHIKKVPFTFVDVGGQRAQRTKWFQCFQEVTSILFMVASNGFDQVLVEDRLTNRLVESLNIFHTIANERCFASASIVLFLNKADMLAEKIKYRDIRQYFPSFPAQMNPHNLEHVQDYLIHLFDSQRIDKTKLLYHHFTTATDTDKIRIIFEAVRNTILENNLKDLVLF